MRFSIFEGMVCVVLAALIVWCFQIEFQRRAMMAKEIGTNDQLIAAASNLQQLQRDSILIDAQVDYRNEVRFQAEAVRESYSKHFDQLFNEALDQTGQDSIADNLDQIMIEKIPGLAESPIVQDVNRFLIDVPAGQSPYISFGIRKHSDSSSTEFKRVPWVKEDHSYLDPGPYMLRLNPGRNDMQIRCLMDKDSGSENRRTVQILINRENAFETDFQFQGKVGGTSTSSVATSRIRLGEKPMVLMARSFFVDPPPTEEPNDFVIVLSQAPLPDTKAFPTVKSQGAAK